MKIVFAIEFGISRKEDGSWAWVTYDYSVCAAGCKVWQVGPIYLTKLAKDCI